MKYCSRCICVDTRPGSIFKEIDGKLVCQACINFEARKNVDWNQRYNLLKRICSGYRGIGKPYDCAIPVSGGKDSHFLVWLARKELGMNPLLIRIGDGFSITKAGRHNIRNLQDTFNCDMVEFTPSIDVYRRMARVCFEKLGSLPFIDGSIYVSSCDIVSYYGLQLTFFGEDPLQEYGTTQEPLKELEVLSKIMMSYDGNFWKDNGFTNEEVAFLAPPMYKHKTLFTVAPIFISHYIPWSGTRNYDIAKQHGFQDLTGEWNRTSDPTHYDSVDCIGWAVSHQWKYQKFGFGRGTDLTSRWIREGNITREDGIEIARQYDGILDSRTLDDFLSFTGYSLKEYFDIADQWWNKELFDYREEEWVPKFRIGVGL